MSKALIEHLQKNHGLAGDADSSAARTLGRTLVKGGTLSIDQYRELCAGKAFSSPAAPAAKPDSDVQPVDLFGGAKGNPRAGVDVKKASDIYDGTLKRKSYPGASERKGSPHPLAGQDVTFEEKGVYDLSQKRKAQMGAWHRLQLQKQLGRTLMRDHEWQLVKELLHEEEWVGDFPDPSSGGVKYIGTPRKLADWEIKTMLEDSTSGGANLVPYFYDVELVTFPLLQGQLAPFVDQKDLPTSDQVKQPSFQNLTINEGPAEGDSPGITLQTTTSLAGIYTLNVYNATAAITAGRFLLEDSPIKLQEAFVELYKPAMANFLDSEIATGAGSSFILGIANTSSPGTYTAANSTAGPVTVADMENMFFTMPVQYRNTPELRSKLAWICRDSLYGHIRKIPVAASGSPLAITDQRLILGYDLASYELFGTRAAIVDSYNSAATLAASTLILARLDMYRLWRRKGMSVEVSTEGKTLMLANELLMTIRARYAGAHLWPLGVVVGSNFSVHGW